MAFLKLVLSFAPWLAFLIIARDSLFRLKLGLVVALALSVVMGVARLHRGIILWVGLAFFSYATVAVVVFDDMWAARHMGVLANGALAAGAWFTIAVGKPFTLDYAREHIDPAFWNHPSFIRTNVLITAVWAMAFTVSALLAWGKMANVWLPDWGYEVLSYTILLATAGFTSVYSSYLQRARRAPRL